jgi:hypothetical protein
MSRDAACMNKRGVSKTLALHSLRWARNRCKKFLYRLSLCCRTYEIGQASPHTSHTPKPATMSRYRLDYRWVLRTCKNTFRCCVSLTKRLACRTSIGTLWWLAVWWVRHSRCALFVYMSNSTWNTGALRTKAQLGEFAQARWRYSIETDPIQKCGIERVRIRYSPYTNFIMVIATKGAIDSHIVVQDAPTFCYSRE